MLKSHRSTAAFPRLNNSTLISHVQSTFNEPNLQGSRPFIFIFLKVFKAIHFFLLLLFKITPKLTSKIWSTRLNTTNYGGCCMPGGGRGLQNRCGAVTVPGWFNSFPLRQLWDLEISPILI